jgi:ACR3 family arsenite efflux pump ArsB
MSFLTKLQPLCIIASALTGVALGKLIPPAERFAGNFIELFLTCMLFFVFLNIEIKEILKSFSDPRFSVSALLLNFVFTPLFAFRLSKLLLSAQVDLQIGFIMLMVTPCTDWYLIFTGVARGNVALGASILPLNLILQIVLLPVYLLLFMGTEVSFGLGTIMHSIAFVLVLPLVAANAVKLAARKSKRRSALEKITKKADDIQFILLCLAIIAMFASQGALLLDNSVLFIKILPASLLFFVVIFFLSLCTGKVLKMPFENTIPLVFTTSARNSPISLAIATITFPLRPVISLVLVIGPLLELPILALVAALLKMMGPEKPSAL